MPEFYLWANKDFENKQDREQYNVDGKFNDCDNYFEN